MTDTTNAHTERFYELMGALRPATSRKASAIQETLNTHRVFTSGETLRVLADVQQLARMGIDIADPATRTALGELYQFYLVFNAMAEEVQNNG